ncbi:hypothetical protein ACFL0M_01300 [Thermodesulfobacteriota bacterium]
MARRATPAQPVIVPKQWSAPDDIDLSVAKLQRRISELEALDIQSAVIMNMIPSPGSEGHLAPKPTHGLPSYGPKS